MISRQLTLHLLLQQTGVMNTCVDSYVPAIILSNIAVFVLSYVLDINSHSNTFSFEFKTGESCL